ncbi:MAG TPA: N-acetyltransferase [Candidatus Limnocylindria bacterium]
MSISPHEVSAPAWSIRPELPVDLDHIHELHRAAFSGPAEAELVDAIRSGPDFVPELSQVAVTADGSVLGHVLLSRIALRPEEEGRAKVDVLALAPLAVLPPHQGRGIGASLMEEALAIADARDEPMTVVLGSPAFYGRFGFVPALDMGITGPYDDAGDAFQARPRPGLEDAELPSGTAIYPAMFGSP